jgi:hypothetical protein
MSMGISPISSRKIVPQGRAKMQRQGGRCLLPSPVPSLAVAFLVFGPKGHRIFKGQHRKSMLAQHRQNPLVQQHIVGVGGDPQPGKVSRELVKNTFNPLAHRPAPMRSIITAFKSGRLAFGVFYRRQPCVVFLLQTLAAVFPHGGQSNPTHRLITAIVSVLRPSAQSCGHPSPKIGNVGWARTTAFISGRSSKASGRLPVRHMPIAPIACPGCACAICWTSADSQRAIGRSPANASRSRHSPLKAKDQPFQGGC